jgi:predicted kinase
LEGKIVRIYIVRGLPGSGKSTKAKTLNGIHLEADMFFYRDGEYCFDKTKVRDAHRWCQKTARQAMESGMDVVIANTFCEKREIQPYLDFAKATGHQMNVYTMKNKYGSIHGVPEETIQRMSTRWEHYEGEEICVD